MRYGVVPSGGLGTRSGLPHSKELALVGGIPVIEYIFDRLVIAGIHKIFVTTAPDKTDLIDYLKNVSPNRKLITISIGERQGLLDGIISPAHFMEKTDEIYFGLPDTVWFPEDGFKEIAKVKNDLVLGCLPSDTPEIYGSVNVEKGIATSIIEKPKNPTSPWIWAFGKFKVSLIPTLLNLSKSDPTFTNVLGSYAKSNSVKVVTFKSGKYFDIGTPAGLSATNQYVQK